MSKVVRRIAIAVALFACTLSLSACDSNAVIGWFAPKEQTHEAEAYFADIQAGNFANIRKNIDPKYQNDSLEPELIKIASLFPHAKPKSVKLANFSTFATSGTTTYNLTFDYEFPDRTLVANMILETRDGRTQIEGLHVTQLTGSVANVNAFNLAGKRPVDYAILGLTIFIALFTVTTAIVAFFTYIPKRKWLWIIFILIGFGQFYLNWTTGQVAYNLLAFQLFGAAFSQQFLGPVIISFGFPLGAILFWERRRGWREVKNAPKDTDTDMRG
jgi:hypothetical protein